MRVNITGRHMEITDALRQYVEKKTSRLVKYHNRISDMEVVVEEEGLLKKCEIIIKVDHADPFVVTERGDDLYACVDTSVDKIERQLKRFKEKSRIRKGRTGTAEAAGEVTET
jgi:putative sigma-54 modulation protein